MAGEKIAAPCAFVFRFRGGITVPCGGQPESDIHWVQPSVDVSLHEYVAPEASGMDESSGAWFLTALDDNGDVDIRHHAINAGDYIAAVDALLEAAERIDVCQDQPLAWTEGLHAAAARVRSLRERITDV